MTKKQPEQSASKTQAAVADDPVGQVRKELDFLQGSLIIPPFGLTLRRHRQGESLEGSVVTAYVNRQGPYRWFCKWQGSDADLKAFSETANRLHDCFPNLVRELNGASWLELATRFAPAERDFSTAGPIFTLPIEPVGLCRKALVPLQRAEAAAVCYAALIASGVLKGSEHAFQPDAGKGFSLPVPADNPDWLNYRTALAAIQE